MFMNKLRKDVTRLVLTNHMIYSPHPNLILYKKINDDNLPFNPYYNSSIVNQVLSLIETNKRFKLIPPEYYFYDSTSNHWLRNGEIIWRPNVITSVNNSFYSEFNPIEILNDDRYYLDEDFQYYPNLKKIDDF